MYITNYLCYSGNKLMVLYIPNVICSRRCVDFIINFFVNFKQVINHDAQNISFTYYTSRCDFI